jgi:hypothetical protein
MSKYISEEELKTEEKGVIKMTKVSMSKEQEISRFRELAQEDTYLGLLLRGFEDKFEELVTFDYGFSIMDMLAFRDREIDILRQALQCKDKELQELKNFILSYLYRIDNALEDKNFRAIQLFVSTIRDKLIEGYNQD